MRKTFFALALLLIGSASIARATPSDVETIRAVRLENNDAIEARDVASMRKAWAPNIRLIEGDGKIFSGVTQVSATYAHTKFNDPNFGAYVRRPSSIIVNPDGVRAAEYGAWTEIDRTPERVLSGTYLASWRKIGGAWKIVYEAYSVLNLAPQSVADVLHPAATVRLAGTPDWLAITPDAVWVSNATLKVVQRIDVRTNRLVARIQMPGKPCSGLAFGFERLWVPVCGAHPSLARVNPRTNAIDAVLPSGPALSEGGVTVSNDSVWLVTSDGTLARIDPRTNRVRQRIAVPLGSYNPLFSNGTIWVTSGANNLLTAIDAKSGTVVAIVPVGLKPRFLTVGGGYVWTLNQGDGTVSKIDARTKRSVARINAEIPGGGGEITYGAGCVWATIIGVPLTRINAATNAMQQWGGRGGDAVRFGGDSIWLTDYNGGQLWRMPIPR